uniref:Alpha-1,6-mannosyl-glycoprotein 2-beta-N-acetylglucosaminyltransferase n=1 Tax=Arcella intermedia TaxID=1963864 RepID=A0A6B2LA95_9EUKA
MQLYHPYASDFFPSGPSLLGTAFMKVGAARRHYWWAWNALFRVVLPQLFPSTSSPSLAILEEDHILTKDSYYLLNFLLKSRKSQCESECFSVNLGKISGDPVDRGADLDYKVVKTITQNFAGMAFSRGDFEKVMGDVEEWCKFNEYNWDWAIFWMMQRGVLPAYTLTPRGSRVGHIGSCGMHHSRGDCEMLIKKSEETFLRPMNERLVSEKWLDMPEEFEDASGEMMKRLKGGRHVGYGGWILNKGEQERFNMYGHDENINVNICMNIAKDPFPL